MKPEQMYQEMRDVAEKLGVKVSEQSFRGNSIPVKSGFCVIQGKMHCIIDKNISLNKKTSVLARSISHLSLENVYIVPAVRESIEKYGNNKKAKANCGK